MVSHQVTDEAPIFMHFFGSFSVGDAGGLDNRFVGAHIVDDSHKTVIQDFDRDAQHLVQAVPLPHVQFCLVHSLHILFLIVRGQVMTLNTSSLIRARYFLIHHRNSQRRTPRPMEATIR